MQFVVNLCQVSVPGQMLQRTLNELDRELSAEPAFAFTLGRLGVCLDLRSLRSISYSILQRRRVLLSL